MLKWIITAIHYITRSAVSEAGFPVPGAFQVGLKFLNIDRIAVVSPYGAPLGDPSLCRRRPSCLGAVSARNRKKGPVSGAPMASNINKDSV